MRDSLNRPNLVVLFGGAGPEHEVSKMSAATIVSNMPEDKYNIIPVYITKEGEWLLYDGAVDNINTIKWSRFGTKAVLSPDRSDKGLLRIVNDKVKIVPVDIVFPVLHGMYGEDGTIQGLCELAGIPYVGCGVLSSAICIDKAATRAVANSLKIKQADALVFNLAEASDIKMVARRVRYKIGYPCFVKPAKTGSSIGIIKVCDKSELAAAVECALEYDNKIVIEKMVEGREFSCAVLGRYDGEVAATVAGEILADGEFYDYDAKYVKSGSKTIIPADIDEEVHEKIKEISIKIFKAVEGSGLARVDFFMEEGAGNVIFNEINTMPGFTKISMYPMLWGEMGISLTDLIDRLILMAI